MRAREARTSITETIPLSEVHAGDLLVPRGSGMGGGDFYVAKVSRRTSEGKVTLEIYRDGKAETWTVPQDRDATVRSEFPCDCRGSGVYSWGGSVNGKPLKTGPHFACAEKGYQSRSDVIRNITYWNKYARISF